MKIKKLFRIGCGIIIVFLIMGFVGLIYFGNKKYDYYDSSYQRDYTWEDIEVGTIRRLPIGNPIPNGHYCAVIAFKKGQIDDAGILLEGPKGEVPMRPKFISGSRQEIIYHTHKGDVKIDLSQLENYPKWTDSSSRPLQNLIKN